MQSFIILIKSPIFPMFTKVIYINSCNKNLRHQCSISAVLLLNIYWTLMSYHIAIIYTLLLWSLLILMVIMIPAILLLLL